jgi:hypothetical protein
MPPVDVAPAWLGKKEYTYHLVAIEVFINPRSAVKKARMAVKTVKTLGFRTIRRQRGLRFGTLWTPVIRETTIKCTLLIFPPESWERC